MTDTPKRAINGGDEPTADSPTTDSRTTVTELRQIVRAFVAERSWEKFHNAKNLSMSIAIEAAELMEHFQWLTTDETVAGEQQDRGAITDELADVTCYVLALANVLGVDLTDAVTNKMVKNRIKYPVERA
jgi:NTP pyrophosphatase (non-canonical NTP hydrolase)